uniref:G-protein coupled receptors family 1 profile domain-containing protein n=1 Tax=Ascaris lumbricoides TaxID=6252 RepID=A0A9J2Q919_ASCLU
MDGETLNDLVRFIRIPAAALAITVNILIVIVIFRYSAMRSNASNLLIAQLAFADVLMGVALIIRFVTNEIQLASGCTIFDAALCMVVGAPTIFSAHVDQITMFGIAIERLLCMKFPIQYRKLGLEKFDFSHMTESDIKFDVRLNNVSSRAESNLPRFE